MAPNGDISRITLSLNLENTKNFEVFMKALEDQRIRRGLTENVEDLPTGVAQITTLVDDERFLALATVAAQRYFSMVQGATSVEDVQRSGQDLYDYLDNTYPEGLELLADYGRRALPEMIRLSPGGVPQLPKEVRGGVAVEAYAVANVGVLANAAVYTNVAAATQVAVALVAVAVVGVFVSSSGRLI